MAQVTIEGTITPSVFLPRGERITVEDGPRIRKLIRAGFVKIVPPAVKTLPAVIAEIEETVTAQLETADAERMLTGAPARNASRQEWAAWLEDREIEYPLEATRADLIALWDARDDG